MDNILNPFNDTFKYIFTQQPIVIVLFLIFVLFILFIIAIRAGSKQQSEDHEEKKMMLSLFSDLKTAINSMSAAQERRNETVEIQIKEQQTTNKNLHSLNSAFADYHSSLADTIVTIFKSQITGRLDNVESKVDELYVLVKNKPDCNDEILNRLNDLGKNFIELKTMVTEKEDK